MSSKLFENKEYENKEILNSILNILIESTRHGFSVQFREENLELSKPFINEGDIFGHKTAIILMSGKNLRILLKIHFHLNQMNAFLIKRFSLKENELDKKIGIDFFKELCNLSCGFFKHNMNDIGIFVVSSLPLVIRGFDEYFEGFSDKSFKHNFMWKVKILDFNFTCSCEIFSPDFNYFKNINWLSLNELKIESEKNKIEFL